MPVGPRASETPPASRPRPELRKKKPFPELKRRTEPGDDEPQTEPEAVGPPTAWYQHPGVAVAALVLFFPLGLVLVSQTHWPARTKVAVLGGGAAVLLVLLAIVVLRPSDNPTTLNAGALSSTTVVAEPDASTTVPVDPTGSTVVDAPVTEGGVEPEAPVGGEEVPLPTGPAVPAPVPAPVPGGPGPGQVTPSTNRPGNTPTPTNPPPVTQAPPVVNPPAGNTPTTRGQCHKSYSGLWPACVPISSDPSAVGCPGSGKLFIVPLGLKVERAIDGVFADPYGLDPDGNREVCG
jgi:hypothetical protein